MSETSTDVPKTPSYDWAPHHASAVSVDLRTGEITLRIAAQRWPQPPAGKGLAWVLAQLVGAAGIPEVTDLRTARTACDTAPGAFDGAYFQAFASTAPVGVTRNQSDRTIAEKQVSTARAAACAALRARLLALLDGYRDPATVAAEAAHLLTPLLDALVQAELVAMMRGGIDGAAAQLLDAIAGR